MNESAGSFCWYGWGRCIQNSIHVSYQLLHAWMDGLNELKMTVS